MLSSLLRELLKVREVARRSTGLANTTTSQLQRRSLRKPQLRSKRPVSTRSPTQQQQQATKRVCENYSIAVTTASPDPLNVMSILTTDPDTAPATEPAAELAADASATNGTATTPAKKSSNGKRKSAGGVPEHKTKKTPAKSKKKVPELRLDAGPGDMYMVAMRGYQPWPVIVCDEEMLPESLLSKRPVSAKRIDGTYREDFLEGGKNAKDRRYPIMFLGTNEL